MQDWAYQWKMPFYLDRAKQAEEGYIFGKD